MLKFLTWFLGFLVSVITVRSTEILRFLDVQDIMSLPNFSAEILENDHLSRQQRWAEQKSHAD